ncbi:hypothetical protein ABIE49_001141 [Bradyrhizobium sp. OAE829]
MRATKLALNNFTHLLSITHLGGAAPFAASARCLLPTSRISRLHLLGKLHSNVAYCPPTNMSIASTLAANNTTEPNKKRV